MTTLNKSEFVKVIETPHGPAEYYQDEKGNYVYVLLVDDEVEQEALRADAMEIFEFKKKYDIIGLEQKFMKHFRQPVKSLIDEKHILLKIGDAHTFKIALEDVHKPVMEILNA